MKSDSKNGSTLAPFDVKCLRLGIQVPFQKSRKARISSTAKRGISKPHKGVASSFSLHYLEAFTSVIYDKILDL